MTRDAERNWWDLQLCRRPLFQKTSGRPSKSEITAIVLGFGEPSFLLFYHLLLPYASCYSSHQSFSCLVCIFFSIIKRWMANTQSYDWGGWLVPNAVSCVRLFVVIWLSLCLEIHNWFMVIVFEMNFMWFINSNLDWDIGLSLSLTIGVREERASSKSASNFRCSYCGIG